MNNLKVHRDIILMFIFNVGLIIFGLFLGETQIIASSVIIFVILSVTIHILDAINNLKDKDK